MVNWSGCDNTSHIFNKGKIRLVKLLKKSPHIRNASETLSSPQSSQEEVGGASADVFKIVYGEHVDRGGLAFKILPGNFWPDRRQFLF